MIDIVSVDSELADAVEKEMFSIKPRWQYMPFTTNFYERTKDEELKNNLHTIMENFPVSDTQKFTDVIFNIAGKPPATHSIPYKSFVEMRNDPNSRYNRNFPNMGRLLNHLQSKYIPQTYNVKRMFINMQTIRPVFSLNSIHPDFKSKDVITILYYVNNSDGDTYFFSGSECIKRVSPLKGVAAIYPSNTLHAGSTPTKNETRIVINICFGPKGSNSH